MAITDEQYKALGVKFQPWNHGHYFDRLLEKAACMSCLEELLAGAGETFAGRW